jgi:hypothetical protein
MWVDLKMNAFRRKADYLRPKDLAVATNSDVSSEHVSQLVDQQVEKARLHVLDNHYRLSNVSKRRQELAESTRSSGRGGDRDQIWRFASMRFFETINDRLLAVYRWWRIKVC